MRKLGLIPKIGIAAVVFCAAMMGAVAMKNDTYAYTVSAGMRIQQPDSKCEANDAEKKIICKLTFYPYLAEDYTTTTRSWEDYFCTRFIGYNLAKDAKSAEDLTEGWLSLSGKVKYPVDSETSVCIWGNIQHHQVGVFRSKGWTGDGKPGFGNLKETKMNFDISYNDFIEKAEKTETEAETKYSSAICVKAYSGWAVEGTETNGRGYGYWCTGVFSFSFTKDYTLTAKSISTTGESLSNIPGLGDKTKTVKYGKSASVQHGDNIGYVFVGWKKNINDSSYTGGTSGAYTVNSLTENITVYAVYEKKRTLTVENINIYNGSFIGGNASYSGYSELKRIPQKNVDPERYKFIGWKSVIAVGTNGIIERTNSHDDEYKTYLDPESKQENTVYYKDGDSNGKGIYTVIYNYFDVDRTLRAYYAPKYKLTIDGDDGVTITVDRKFSYYDTRGRIDGGNAIFKDDRLKICLNIKDGYSLESFSIKENRNGLTTPIGDGGRYCTDAKDDEYQVVGDTKITVRTGMGARFNGMSRVSGVADDWANVPSAQKASTGYVGSNKKVIYNIENCDPVSGCTARFEHWLKRVAGNGDTQFSVNRTSNYYTIGSGNVVKSSTENFSANDYNGKMVIEADFRNRLYPGQVVCETLTFVASVSVGEVSTTACASALGKAQPEGPNGESTLVDLKVKNNSVSKYNALSSEVWAKPGDKLTFLSTYDPVLQYTYSLIPEKMRINDGTIYSNSAGKYLGKDNSSVNKSMFNSKKPETMRDWNNAYNVYSENFTSSGFQKVYKFGGGKDEKQENSDDHTVDKSEVGLRLTEKAEINYGRDGNECENKNCTTPSQVEFTSDGDGRNVANVKTDNIRRIATANVPYNFNTGAEVLTENDKAFFAGEKASVRFGVSVLKRINNETTDGTEEQAYATRMHNASMKMIFYYADDAKSGSGSWGNNATDLCKYFGLTNNGQDCGYARELDNLTLEPEEDGGSNEYSATVNIRDMKAGSKICAAVAVYPSNSGYDRQLSSFGSGTWRISNSKCFSIAKKPSFQVWGGSVYSAGKIELKTSAKNNLFNYSHLYPYSMTSSGNNRVFGSWVELGLVANGAVKGLASGAGTGYSKVGAGLDEQGRPLAATDEDLGGSAEGASVDYCVRSTLSFANNNCGGSSGTVGGLSGTLSNNVASDKSALILEFTDGDGAGYTIETAKEISEIKDFAGTVVVNDDGTESLKTTRVIASTGNIKINGDIEYRDSGYTGLGEVPKIIIYSGKNILISCNVNRIDAVLIAENGINTCDDSGDVNNEARSRQLRINGSIISDVLTLGRTYGAATGAWSIVPAEIINYDTSLYLWSRKLNATTSMDKLVEAYTNELAPRY